MEKTWKPITAGILDIISVVLGLIGVIGGFIAIEVVYPEHSVPGFVEGIYLGLSFPTIILAILAPIGGAYALQRKKWGWALTGSICALIPTFVLGVAAIILVALSKDEFE